MSTTIGPQPARSLCNACRFSLRAQKDVVSIASRIAYARTFARQCSIASETQRGDIARRKHAFIKAPGGQRRAATTAKPDPANEPSVPATHLPIVHGMVADFYDEATRDPTQSKKLPEEKEILHVLQRYHQFAQQLMNEKISEPKTNPRDGGTTATSALLSSVNRKQVSSNITKADVLNTITDNATRIMESKNVFITPDILKAYISLQALLDKPQSLPYVLNLYCTKPSPRPLNSAPWVTYSPQNPSSPSTAIPPAIADSALDAGIHLHDLPLTLSIIDETYCTNSYMRSKILRSALFPISGAILTPLAAYSLASRFALLQNTMDDSYATGVAMAGMLTYAAAVGTIGYVALTTANDQMVRVTWASGAPLWERWIREEERAAVDRVAQAWGFQSKERWGDEEGKDWDELREWVGLRGMMLDRVELMEGME